MLNFNPESYQGTWFELGKYPVQYESVKCNYSTAIYRYNKQGNYINVLNTCYGDNNQPLVSILGIAKPKNTSGEFNIKFFSESFTPYPVNPYPQPYNVLWTDYNNFSFVGDDQSFYILIRKPYVTVDQFKFILNKIQNLGYDIEKVNFNFSSDRYKYY